MCKNHSKYYNIMSWIIPRFWLVYISDLLEDRRIDDVANNSLSRLYYIKQIDSKLPWVCLVIDHRGLSKMKFIHFSFDEVISDMDRVVLSAYCDFSGEKVDWLSTLCPMCNCSVLTIFLRHLLSITEQPNIILVYICRLNLI